MEIRNVKTIAAVGFLLAYIAILLKLIVFKYPPGMVFDVVHSNYMPFKTILPYLTGYPTWIVARNNLLGNIIPFIPLGFLMPLLYRSLIWKRMFVVAIGFALTVEIVQVALRMGIFDVDDILLNTLGVILGYCMFAVAMRIVKLKGIWYTWDMKRAWSISIIAATIVVCVFAVWKFQSSAPTASTATQVDKVALAQLQADLKNVSPHFIDASKANGQILTPEEQKIKDDVVAIFTAGMSDNKDYYSRLWLDAVGKRYILVSQPSAGSSFDEIIDSQTGTVMPISGEANIYLASEGRNIALYINFQAIYTYALDQASVLLVPGSQLSGTETYHSGTSDFTLVPVQTHTKNSITISTFDSSQLVQNPDAQPNAMQTMSKKVREVTLSF